MSLQAQEKWSLQQCVQYALDSNISIKQNEIQAQVAGITYKQSQFLKYQQLTSVITKGTGLVNHKILPREFWRIKIFSRLG